MDKFDPATRAITTPEAEADQAKIDKTLARAEKDRLDAKRKADKASMAAAASARKVADAVHSVDDHSDHERDHTAHSDLHPMPPKVRVVDTTADPRPTVSRSLPSADEMRAAELQRDAEIRERANAAAIKQAAVDTATSAASFLPNKEEDSNPGA